MRPVTQRRWQQGSVAELRSGTQTRMSRDRANMSGKNESQRRAMMGES